jgi:hypothetical protein
VCSTRVGRRTAPRHAPAGGSLRTNHSTGVESTNRVRASVSPTNLRNLVETGSHFHMANLASLPVPIPKRIARTKAFLWASHVRPIPA